MPDLSNHMHGPHCKGEMVHCGCLECHGREVVEPVLETRPCGHHCMGHFCELIVDDAGLTLGDPLVNPELLDENGKPKEGSFCYGKFSGENVRTHCRCNNCHAIPDVALTREQSLRQAAPTTPDGPSKYIPADAL